MNVRKVEVLSLHKNEVIYKNIKNKVFKQMLIMLLAFIMPLSAMFFSQYGMDKSIFTNIINLSNPIYSPYIDTGGVSFVDGKVFEFDNKVLQFELPLASSQMEIKDDCISITVKESAFISAPEGGIISEVGEASGIKYIKILHSKDIESIIENIDISGVVVATVVKKGDKLASAIVGETLVFKIIEKGKPVSNFKLTNNVLTWEN